jgi:hypothetical protein
MTKAALGVALGLLVTVLAGCQTVYPCAPLYHRPGLDFMGVYEGTLPCPDCRGIETELVLWSRGRYVHSESWYRITETHVGRPETENIFVREGPWYFERGSGDHPDDAVYSLDMGRGGALNFVVDDERTLTLLRESDNRRIVSAGNFSLRRVALNRERCFETSARCASSRRGSRR